MYVLSFVTLLLFAENKSRKNSNYFVNKDLKVRYPKNNIPNIEIHQVNMIICKIINYVLTSHIFLSS